MTRRQVGFLLIGSGLGLILSCIAAIEMTVSLHHLALEILLVYLCRFMFQVHWQAYFWAAIPWLLLVTGATMIRQRSRG